MVENSLGPIVEEISVSPQVVKKIVDGVIDETWVRALAEVEKRSKAMNSKSEEQKHIKAVSDLKPLLENLIGKVSSRVYCLVSWLTMCRHLRGLGTLWSLKSKL